MSADQAFDNLLNRNAIVIPSPAPGGEGVRRPPGEKGKDRRTGGADVSDDKVAMQVSSLLDDDVSDYSPSPAGRTDAGGAAAHEYPTEADLPAAAEGGPTGDVADEARREGALIVGRDTAVGSRRLSEMQAAHPEWDGDDGVPVFSTIADECVERGRESSAGNDSELTLARRVRRFAYLPVSGMDRFEVGARKLMANLSLRHPERPSLAIAGTARGEGRTELSIRLALAMAKKVEQRILLVDGDTGKPDVAVRLGVSARRFVLADALGGGCRVGEALTAADDDNLYVLPARAPERDGEEILDAGRAGKFFDRLHRLFDFIIIDCGPLDRGNAALFSRLAGSTALAGRSGKSRVADLRNAAADLLSRGVDLAGLILVGA